ncbi:hypothetical protein BOX15_Mlig015424g1 [Macrostomum lignano]|uniref:Uncharacterized protein n=1 Tax=Macrostomum lignano TaxID=282301 RepID=A0A267FY66_9PLAT|nr:hypothetical protein BOX15_Mlig015424g1 [Macrostomum lignano]
MIRSRVDEYSQILWKYLAFLIAMNGLMLLLILILTVFLLLNGEQWLSSIRGIQDGGTAGLIDPNRNSRGYWDFDSMLPTQAGRSKKATVATSDASYYGNRWPIPGRFRLPRLRKQLELAWDGIFFRYPSSSRVQKQN